MAGPLAAGIGLVMMVRLRDPQTACAAECCSAAELHADNYHMLQVTHFSGCSASDRHGICACLHTLFQPLCLVSVGDSGESANKRQRGRPKGSRNRRTMERQDQQTAVSLPSYLLVSLRLHSSLYTGHSVVTVRFHVDGNVRHDFYQSSWYQVSSSTCA